MSEEARIATLDPRLQTAVAELKKRAGELGEGIDFLVTQAHRTAAEQTQLWRQGRDMPGPIVTHARASETPHCRSPAGAFDFAIRRNGVIDWKPLDLYRKLGRLGVELGLVYGGDWLHPRTDPDHLELSDWKQLPFSETQ